MIRQIMSQLRLDQARASCNPMPLSAMSFSYVDDVRFSSLALHIPHRYQHLTIMSNNISSSSSSTQTQAHRRQRSVQFSSSRSQVTTYEEEQTTSDKWYSTKEKAQFKQEMLRDVRYLRIKRKVHKQDVNEDDLYRCIGIEKLLLPTAIGQGRVYRSNHVNITLMAQDQGYSEEELCHLSKMLSRPSRKRAPALAICPSC